MEASDWELGLNEVVISIWNLFCVWAFLCEITPAVVVKSERNIISLMSIF